MDGDTSQGALEGVACGATGLERSYFEDARDGAHHLTVDPTPETLSSSPTSGGGVVAFRVRSADPEVPFRLMGNRALLPGLRRRVHDGGVIVYMRVLEPVLKNMPRIYEFVAKFGSESAADNLANRLWSHLQGTDAVLEIRRVEVPIQGAAIREALLTAAR